MSAETAKRTRHIQEAQPASSETRNAVGNSEDVARLYTELVNSFSSNDTEAVRLIYRALLRLGRSRTEILAEVAWVAAAQEATQTGSGSLGQAIAPTEASPPSRLRHGDALADAADPLDRFPSAADRTAARGLGPFLASPAAAPRDNREGLPKPCSLKPPGIASMPAESSL